MEAENGSWEQVKELLADALERSPEERAAFLDRACAGDEALRAELESLLPDAATEERFLVTPAPEWFRVPEPGGTLGGYRLVRVIGEGGMGRVYEATQERPERTVALKVLRPGHVAPETRRRFAWEVEALGRLDHPAIARIYEAGIEPGEEGAASVPWLAMELVSGKPILQAADDAGLDRFGRLRLFARVCDGVVHAHQRGVIHRDLKPDNVLVDEEGSPHVLDFGIARMADPVASAVTAAGEIVGTLPYMSPEQLSGRPERIDVRTDVWALGGILYRLLTGRAPYRLEGMGLAQAALHLEREEPMPAGRFDRALRGDLETILATALAPDPRRRYPSVERLVGDVRRHLANEPITARPQTTLYQLRKLAQRHRGLAAGLGLSVLLLVLAVVGTTAGMLRAARQQARAELERDRAWAANRLLETMLSGVDPGVNGREVRVVDLLDTARSELVSGADFEPQVLASLHATLGRSYANLGLEEEATNELGRATELYEAADGALSPHSIETRAAWIEGLYAQGRIELAEAELTELERTVASLDASDERVEPWIRIRPLELAAAAASARGDAAAHLARCREVYEAWLDANLDGEQANSVDTARNNVAVALLELGRAAEAVPLLRDSLDERSARLGQGHPRVLIQRTNLAAALREAGMEREAAAEYGGLVPLAERTWGRLDDLSISVRMSHASLLAGLGRAEESLAEEERVLAALVERFGEEDERSRGARGRVAELALALGRFSRARVELERILALDTADDTSRARLEFLLARALAGTGLREDALPMATDALQRLERILGPAHVETLRARDELASLSTSLGHAEEAVDLARRNLDLASSALPAAELTPFRLTHAHALADAGRTEEALAELQAAPPSPRASPEARERYDTLLERLRTTR